jgi:hypothetical protein
MSPAPEPTGRRPRPFLRFHAVLIEVFAEVARKLPSTYTAIFTAIEFALAAMVVRDPVSIAPDEGLLIVTVGTADVVLVLDGRCRARSCPARTRRDRRCS